MSTLTTDTTQLRDHREWADLWLRAPKAAYVGGDFLRAPAGPLTTSENPANGTALGSFHASTAGEVEAALEAATQAFRSGQWPTMSRRKRADTLRQIAAGLRAHQGELATIEALDNGKLYSEAFQDDLPEAADVFDYYAGWIDKHYGDVCPVEDGFLNYTLREPLGVCALIVPWNFPLLLAAWKIAPALAMGNTVVVKPSPFTSFSILRWAEILRDQRILPAGVFNVVLGGASVGAALSSHQLVQKISFTGSTFVGKEVAKAAAASNLKSVSLELGGKSPNILFEDTPDVDAALDRAFGAMFSHKGEKCSEPTRLLVHASLYDRALAELTRRADAVRCGDPFDPASQQGAQCHKEHFEKILGYIATGKAEGARLIAGGGRDPRPELSRGYFVRPTIFADVAASMRIAQEEIFGPVLAVSRFQTEDEAVDLANATIYGLAAGFYTKDVSRVHRLAKRLDAGMVFVNRYGCYDFASPFGGSKQSGWGKELGRQSLDAYTKVKSVWVAY